MKTAQWHFAALKWVDRAALISIDTDSGLSFMAFFSTKDKSDQFRNLKLDSCLLNATGR